MPDKCVCIHTNLILAGIPPKAGYPTYRFSPASGGSTSLTTLSLSKGGIFNILWRGGQVEFDQKKIIPPKRGGMILFSEVLV
jgi:hypothetical protein